VRRRLRELDEQLPRRRGRERLAELLQDPCRQLEARARQPRRREGAPDPLHAALEVGERAVGLGPHRGRQHQLGALEQRLLERAQLVLPAAMWAETDGTFTNFQRRVQRIRRAFAAPGLARTRFELAAGILKQLGKPLAATSARELFVELAKTTPDYAGLDHRGVGPMGKALPLQESA